MNIFRLDSPFMRFMSRLTDIVGLGVVALLCSVPLVTIGASVTALYYTMLKLVRRKEGSPYRFFFKAFKENFWKSTALWLIMAVVLAVLYVDFTLLYNLDLANESIAWIGFIIISVLAALIGSYVFPLQAQFENPVGRTIKNAFILSIMNLPRSILILLVKFSPLLVLMFNPTTLYILGIFCLAGIPYLETELFVKIFDKYIPEEEEPEEEEDTFRGIDFDGQMPTPAAFISGDDAEYTDDEEE